MNSNDTKSVPITGAALRLPRDIWALGFVSMFMDISSELVHSLLPVFMVSVLGTSVLAVGMVEGIAEASASISRMFSGALSDYFGRRKLLVLLGYALSAATKPVFPMASSIAWVAGARFMDRVGKGIRGAPRDALMADITPTHLRGAAYGLRQALDTIGAVLGPSLAVVFMAFLHDIKAVLWVAVIPALIAVILLAIAVKEPERSVDSVEREPLRLRDAAKLGMGFWLIVVLGAILALARFSEAFLVLRALDAGMSIAYVPVVMIVMNVAYAAGAYPAGSASDKLSPRALLLFGLAALILADLVLAIASSRGAVLVGAALWGLHMAFTQGLFLKLVADTVPAELRGSAFGAFNLVTGISVLLASTIAGTLWTSIGPSATFLTGGAFAVAAAIGVAAYREPKSVSI